METLEEQVKRSVRTTLRGRPLSDGEARDLAAFLRSLPAPKVGGDSPSELSARGRDVFESRECGECHAEPVFTSGWSYDVGLVDSVGNRRFNPPSLRGVAWRRAFLHDGSAEKLEDVFTHHAHGLDEPLPPEDLAALTAYLRSL